MPSRWHPRLTEDGHQTATRESGPRRGNGELPARIYRRLDDPPAFLTAAPNPPDGISFRQVPFPETGGGNPWRHAGRACPRGCIRALIEAEGQS